MKTKIKNDFQNSDLFLKMEIKIENWKWKLIFNFEKAIDKQKSMWYIDYRNKKQNQKGELIWEF